MADERPTANQKAKDWETLINALPAILSTEYSKTDVDSNFEEIVQACNEVGQSPNVVFRQLKRISAAVVRQAKRENRRKDKVLSETESSSSDSSDDGQAIEFSNGIKTIAPLKTVDNHRKCSECGGPISKKSKGLCRGCYNDLHSRKCASCGGPISSKSKGLCRACHASRGKSAKKSMSNSTKKVEPKTPVRTSTKKVEPKTPVSKSTKKVESKKDICAQCLDDCVIFENDMCEECYSKTANKRANDTSEDTPVKRDLSKKKLKRPADDSGSESDSQPKKRRMTEDWDE